MTDLNAVALFAVVAERGSFTRAAEHLGMPISTVSRKVAELELAIGARLLERSTRHLRVTEIGAAYLAHCRRGLEAFEMADLVVQDRQAVLSGTLRISYAPNLSEGIFSPVMTLFQRAHPKARIQAFVTERKVDLIADGVDLAFRVGDLADSTLVARRVTSYRHLLVASPDYLAMRGEPRSPDDLSAHRLIAFGSIGLSTTWRLSDGSRQVSLPVEPIFQANDNTALIQAAIGGLGIADLPSILVGQLIRYGALVPVMKDWVMPEVRLTAVHAGTRNMSRLVREFLDHAVAHLEKRGAD